MRIEHLELKGFSTAFPDPVTVPIGDLPPGVHAVTGPNGAGKTTFLELVPAALHRRLPGYDDTDPVDHATGKDSYIEVRVNVDGRGAYLARVNMDGPRRQTDARLQLVRPDGSLVDLNDGKRSTYDAAVLEHFLPWDVFINSAFGAQGRGDEFTRRKPSQRKDLFAEFLGLTRMLEMSKTAGEAAALAASSRERLAATLAQIERDASPLIESQLDADEATVAQAEAAARGEQPGLQARIADLEGRAALLADQTAAYASAQQTLTNIRARLAERRDEERRLTASTAKTLTDLAARRTRVTEQRDRDLHDLRERVAGNQQIQEKADAIRAAVAEVARLEATLATERLNLDSLQGRERETTAALRALERQLATLQSTEESLTRAQDGAAILERVPCGGEGEYAACEFLTQARTAQAAIERLETELRPKATIADQVGRTTLAQGELVAAIAAVQQTIKDLDDARTKAADLARYGTALRESTTRLEELAAQQEKTSTSAAAALADLAKQEGEARASLNAEMARIGQALIRLVDEERDAATHLEQVAAGHAEAASIQEALATARREWDATTAMIATHAAALQEISRKRDAWRAKQHERETVAARLQAVETELLEWESLQQTLGKGGLPDLEIDAAGPTVSSTANVLLQHCFGPRFSIELVTQVERADGKGMKDEFTVRVHDNEHPGPWRDIKQLSGGQRTVVQEALMCAITLYVNERSPMPVRTLWRDETGAALDPENAVRYVEMLRKVRELGGFWHVFFISHSPQATALADAQLQVGDGQVRIVYPPFAA